MQKKEKLCRWKLVLSGWSCVDILCVTNSGKQYIGPFAYLRINIIVAWHRCRDDEK